MSLLAKWNTFRELGEPHDRPSPAEQTIRVKFVSVRSQIIPVRVAGDFNNRDASQVSLKQTASGALKSVASPLAGRNDLAELQCIRVSISP